MPDLNISANEQQEIGTEFDDGQKTKIDEGLEYGYPNQDIVSCPDSPLPSKLDPAKRKKDEQAKA